MTFEMRVTFTLLLAWLFSCARTPDVNKVGIFCSNNGAYTQLTAYAKDNGLDVVKITGPDLVDAVPAMSSVSEFFVNLPNVSISEAKVYWPIRYGDSGTDFSHQPFRIVDVKGAAPLPVSIELVKGNMYRVRCDALRQKNRDLAALEIEDRYYLIDLTPGGSAKATEASAVPTATPRTPNSTEPLLSATTDALTGEGTYTATAPDQGTIYALQLWKDRATGDRVGWITHGGGCNDPIGRLENVQGAGSSLAFTARLHQEDVKFTGQILTDRIDGTMSSTWMNSDDRGRHVSGTWHVVLTHENNSNRNYATRDAWEKEMADGLACCGPTVAEIRPCA